MDKPFQTFNGSKSGNGVYQTIINFIPPCNTFIDAMVGNGGIVTNLNLPEITVINDIEPGTIAKYNCDGHGIIKENLHYKDLIVKYDIARSHTFFYFDPPYLKDTRRSFRNIYKFDWDQSQHVEFLSTVVQIKSNCMISHYPCNVYDFVLKDWNKITFKAQTRRGLVTEAIYMNYPFPERLQDYRYIGSDFIERQQIKRKINRWLNRLDHMAPVERNAFITAINKKYNNGH